MSVTLSLDCTNGHLTASLMNNGDVLSYIQEDVFKEAAEHIAVWTQSALSDHHLSAMDIDSYISVIGPGGFSGVRTGTSFISAMAHVTQKDIVSFSSLEALALSFDDYNDEMIISCLNAKRNSVYLAGYLRKNDQLIAFYPEQLVQREALEDILRQEFTHAETLYLAGHGKDFIKPYLNHKTITKEIWASDARMFTKNHHYIKHHRPHTPLYLRAPDATLPKKSFSLNSLNQI